MLFLLPTLYGIAFCLIFAFAKRTKRSAWRPIDEATIVWGLSYSVGYFVFGAVSYPIALASDALWPGTEEIVGQIVLLGVPGAISSWFLGRSFASVAAAISCGVVTVVLIALIARLRVEPELVLIGAPLIWNLIWFAGVSAFVRTERRPPELPCTHGARRNGCNERPAF